MQQRRRKHSRCRRQRHQTSGMNELSIGAPVVHLEHGVGRYHGLIN
ncbi:MAG: hypothetical protein R3E67_02775 [Pseudomonadales bacterium]